MCDLHYSHKLIMLNTSVLHEPIDINMIYTSSAYDRDQAASLPTFYTICPGHLFYNHIRKKVDYILTLWDSKYMSGNACIDQNSMKKYQ